VLRISFVIACFNSENSLQKVVDEIKSSVCSLSEVSYEIILVDDYSRDNTSDVIKRICQKDNKVKGIFFSKNYGQQPAMLAGFRASEGDLVVYCDDDGQSPVSDLGKFLGKIDEGYDMVWAKYSIKRSGALKRLGSYVNDRMVCFLFSKPKDLYFGNFWVAKRFVVDEACRCTNPFPYLGGVFLKTTTSMANVECKYRGRIQGRSNYSFLKLLSVWMNGFTSFSVVPLRLSSLLGVVVSFFGFILMILLIVSKLKNPDVPLGYSSIMSTVLFLGGMTMILLGILGEYIGRIYININGVPQYVVKEVVSTIEGENNEK